MDDWDWAKEYGRVLFVMTAAPEDEGENIGVCIGVDDHVLVLAGLDQEGEQTDTRVIIMWDAVVRIVSYSPEEFITAMQASPAFPTAPEPPEWMAEVLRALEAG